MKTLRATAVSCSFLAMTTLLGACGGGSTGGTASVTTPAGGGTTTTTSTTTTTTLGTTTTTTTGSTTKTVAYKAFSSIGATATSTLTFSTAQGAATTAVTGAGVSAATSLTSFDTAGNAKTVSGSFTKVVAFNGNTVGQVCDGVAGHAYYSFALDSAVEVPQSEIAGKTFTSYENCAANNDKITFNTDGSDTVTDGSGTTVSPAATVTATFSAAGSLTPDGFRNKITAFKVVNNGVPYYFLVLYGRKVNSESTTGFTDILVPAP